MKPGRTQTTRTCFVVADNVPSDCQQYECVANELDISRERAGSEVHNRTYPLLYTLNSMNFNQGPGFCIFGVRAATDSLMHHAYFSLVFLYLDFPACCAPQRVIDTKSVNLLFASMISLLFTALSVLIGLGTTHWDHRLQGTGDAEVQCARLTSSQLAGLEAWQLMMNTTCIYNLTIGPSGVNLLV